MMKEYFIGDRNICHYCRKPLTDKNRTRDHKTPRKLGGSGRQNYVWACFKCNNEKADIPYDIFIERKRWKPLGIKKPDGTLLQTKRNL